MRVLNILLLSVLLVFNFSGCAQQTSNQKIEDPSVFLTKEEQKPDEAINLRSYETQLVFIKKTAEKWLAVDDRGIIYEVLSPYEGVTPGTICENGYVEETSAGEYKVTLNYPFTSSHVQKLAAKYDVAPYGYAEFILRNLVYNGDASSAITEFRLNNVEIIKTHSAGRIDVSMNFDVKPIKGAYNWGIPDSDGFVKGRNYSFKIYGADGLWLTPDRIYPYLEIGDEQPLPPETLFTPTGIQKVIHENNEWTYYSDGIMLPQTKELKEANLKEYIGTINRINRQTGDMEQLYKGDRNIAYYLFAEGSHYLYILSNVWFPFGEGRPSYFGVLDLNTNKYEKLIEGTVVRGTIMNDQGYLFTADKLIEIDLNTSVLHSVSELPIKPDYTYGGIYVNRIIDGKMYFVISDGGYQNDYVADLKTGKIEAME